MDLLIFVPAVLVGYLFGAIPFGWIFVWLTKGLDLRQIQSGRTGGTNAMRAAGPIIGSLTAVGDVLKGAAAIWLARALFGPLVSEQLLPWVEVAVGASSIVGHNWSIFLGWRGGAGTGPNVGWAGAIWFPIVPIAIVVIVGMILWTGMASLASLAMGAVIVIAFAILYATGVLVTPAYFIGAIATFLIVTWSLRGNIRRVFAGTERMVGPAARRAERKQQRLKARRNEG
ncbi:MAG: glycerol-3-phosphate acyltransferase [Anaerolineae bacterium]|nr:glycerol-3-phosphate acyltransferase [Anaerolineae bacterium]